ncbi:MAG: hypothetical protein ACYST6_17145 [Planctomycetota bacterium]
MAFVGEKSGLGIVEMTLKEFWSKAGAWFHSQGTGKPDEFKPQVDTDGLISLDAESEPASEDKEPPAGEEAPQNDRVVVNAVEPVKKQEPIEKLQEGFNQLVEQLHGINQHLNQQVGQHEQLMSQLERLPRFLESFPAVVENQRKMTQELLEQVKWAMAKNQHFADVVAKIPAETGKQTDALVDINHQLAAGQTDSIMQMSKTFATSDRYLKYLVSKQNRRVAWLFVTAIGVCVLVVLILVGVIIYLKQYG